MCVGRVRVCFGVSLRVSESKGERPGRRGRTLKPDAGLGAMMTRWTPRTHGLRALLQSSHPFAARALVVKAHPDRKELLECKRVVIKVGTAVVSNPNGELVGPSAC